MSRTVDLWQYLPPFLKHFKELKTLLSAEQPEFQTLAAELDAMRDDFFILTASEKGIARYEKLLKIHPNIGDDLEIRRNNVLSRWYDGLPFTIKTLKKRIAIAQGNDDVDVRIDENDPFHIFVYTHMEEDGQIDNLYFILDTMIPANMWCSTQNIVGGTVRLPLNCDVVSSVAGSFALTDDLDCNIRFNNNAFVSVGKNAAAFISINSAESDVIDAIISGAAQEITPEDFTRRTANRLPVNGQGNTVNLFGLERNSIYSLDLTEGSRVRVLSKSGSLYYRRGNARFVAPVGEDFIADELFISAMDGHTQPGVPIEQDDGNGNITLTPVWITVPPTYSFTSAWVVFYEE